MTGRQDAQATEVAAATAGITSSSLSSGESLGEPTWFGEPGRPLFGWVHRPRADVARGGVIICGPLGKQYDTTYYTLRLLAERLADAGFVAVRFDYQGTGDSDGTGVGLGTVESWNASVTSASVLLGSMGCPTVAVIGLQLGALFAAECARRLAADGEPVPALVLWDPPVSGSTFLREQLAIGLLSMGAHRAQDGSFESPGQAWERSVVDDLGLLTFPAAEVAQAVFVLTRHNSTPAAGLVRRLQGPTVSWETFTGHEELYEHAQVPHAAVDRVVGWLDARPFEQCDVSVPAPSTAAVVHAADGQPMTESALILGPDKLFGILSESPAASGPTIVLVGGYVYPHTGPGGSWVQLARQLAATGHRVLRVDLSGIGDSGVRPGQKAQQYFAAEGAEDIAQMAGALSPQDPRNVILVGFCSGAYAVIEAGALLLPRAVITVNYSPEFTPPEVETGEAVDPRRQAFVARPGWIAVLRQRGLLERLRAGMPEWGWALLDKFGIVPLPTTGFSVLLEAGVPTRALACPEDADQFIARTRRRLARMARTGPFSFTLLEDVGHAMLSFAEREAVIQALTREIEDVSKALAR